MTSLSLVTSLPRVVALSLHFSRKSERTLIDTSTCSPVVPSRAVVKPHANDDDNAVPEKHHRDNDCDDDNDDGLRAKSTSTPTHTHTRRIL